MDTGINIAVILGLCCFYPLLAIAIWKVADRLTGSRSTDEALRAETEWRGRLAAPRFDELRRRLRCPVPDDLRWLYAQRDILEMRDVVFSLPGAGGEGHYFQSLMPADRQALDEALYDLGANRFPFAVDDFGNYFFVNVGPEATRDPAVYYLDGESDTIRKIADSVQQFAEALRGGTAP